MKQGSDFPQIVIYSGDDTNDAFARLIWRGAQVVIESDHPTAISKTGYGPGEVTQVITVGEKVHRPAGSATPGQGGEKK